MQFHYCVIDGVCAGGEDGPIHFSEVRAQTSVDITALRELDPRRLVCDNSELAPGAGGASRPRAPAISSRVAGQLIPLGFTCHL